MGITYTNHTLLNMGGATICMGRTTMGKYKKTGCKNLNNIMEQNEFNYIRINRKLKKVFNIFGREIPPILEKYSEKMTTIAIRGNTWFIKIKGVPVYIKIPKELMNRGMINELQSSQVVNAQLQRAANQRNRIGAASTAVARFGASVVSP